MDTQRHSFKSCCVEPGSVLRLLIIADYTHMETVCVLCVYPCMCEAQDPIVSLNILPHETVCCVFILVNYFINRGSLLVEMVQL